MFYIPLLLLLLCTFVSFLCSSKFNHQGEKKESPPFNHIFSSLNWGYKDNLAMSLSKDLIFLILQFCEEENLKRTAHMLEQETGFFFDMKYFEDMILDGKWEDAENYLSAFTGVEDNTYSTKTYFEIRKQKFLEALDKHDHKAALDMLLKDLKVFAQPNKELYKEMTQLLTLDDFREHHSLATYGDTESARKRIVSELRGVLDANPLLQGRTKFPQYSKSRLRRLINQSLNWQHIHCSNPHPQPLIDTLFTDHRCPGPDDAQNQSNEEISLSPMYMSATANLSLATESIISAGTINLENLSNQEDSKDCHDASKIISTKNHDEVMSNSISRNDYQNAAKELPVDFPKSVRRILDMGSQPTSMDFHPFQDTLLLVGTNVADIEIWDVSGAEQLFKRQFVVREDMENNPSISVNRILWNPDGTSFGVAYSERMIRLYSYHKNGNYAENQLEIDAHVGSVNDIAFSKPYDRLVAISCGDDKLIQVWDAVTGAKHYTFEGHGSPVYSICPHMRENIPFLMSISTSGEIKAWLFDKLGSRVTYAAPGLCSMKMAYSTDGKRLFSCGVNRNGEPYIVEWNEAEGVIVRNYLGLCKFHLDMVTFATCSNKFLVAGDDHKIKIWDVNKSEILASIEADGGLPESPYVCFNKKGTLLAVFSDKYQIKILANDHGFKLLEDSAAGSDYSTRCIAETFGKLSVNPNPVPLKARDMEGPVQAEEVPAMLENVKPKGLAESNKLEMPVVSKIVGISCCQSMLLTSEVKTNMIRRLVYTHAGNGILALAQDGIHLLWRWSKNDSNTSGKATTKFSPRLWQPKKGLLMSNDLPENSVDVVIPCFSLSKNDSYVVSASGRVITLYNMLVFKKIRNVMAPPPAATSIVFYPPDNNIIGIGMDDSTILIYNIRVDKVISKLEGHRTRISGLAFSTTLNVLVSSGVDTQIIVWDSVSWEKKRSTMLQISIGWSASDLSETTIELDKNQKQFLAVHQTQLAIYDGATLRCVKQWPIAAFCARISHATYSCDSQLVYAVMRDGIVLIVGASDLTPRFEIDPSAYLMPRHSCYVYPVVVASHPQNPNQFALGLSNGGVVVMEPGESQGKWTED
ncbi:topless-related protein 1-like isoform X2 [Primulina eburnea]|uniref:topless-related protein 1-like isoform X2 n=1 Tax=Primulina eburnea TaxID=1245227 RepID=UPI003C6C2F26